PACTSTPSARTAPIFGKSTARPSGARRSLSIRAKRSWPNAATSCLRSKRKASAKMPSMRRLAKFSREPNQGARTATKSRSTNRWASRSRMSPRRIWCIARRWTKASAQPWRFSPTRDSKPETLKFFMTWDLTSYFPEFDGASMRAFKQAIRADIAALNQTAAALPELNETSSAAWEDIVLRSEDLSRRLSHLGSYVSCLASSDGRNEAYLREEAEMTRIRAEFAKVRIELLRAFKSASDAAFTALSARPPLAGAQNYLNRLREEARRAMPSAQEVLATELGIDGIQAWGQLYNTISSKLEFDMVFPDGARKKLPMSQRRSLLDDPDRRVRKAAFDGGNRAWQAIEDTAAGALNAIAGTRLTLNRHRSVNHFLDIALFQAAITRQTLDAMFGALFSNLAIPRRILRFKAGL